MAIPFDQLPAWLASLKDDFSDNVDKHMRGAARQAAFTIVEGTPVDEGTARSNWRAKVGSEPGDSVFPAYSPGSKLGRGETGNLMPTLDGMYRVIATWTPSTGQDLFFGNSVSYIEDLDNGKSPQGGNFSDASVLSFLSYLSNKRFV